MFLAYRGTVMGESEIEWYKAENTRLIKQNEQLLKDLHRIDNAHQAAVNQCAVMAEFINKLDCVLNSGSVGERGDACTAIDVSNL